MLCISGVQQSESVTHTHVCAYFLRVSSLEDYYRRLRMAPRAIQSVQFSRSVVSDSVTPRTAARQPVHHQLRELAQTHVHRVGDAIQPSRPLSSLLLLPSIFPSIKVFSSELSLCIRWPKDSSFSFSISPSNECSELVSFRIDWFDLLAVQGTQESSPTP